MHAVEKKAVVAAVWITDYWMTGYVKINLTTKSVLLDNNANVCVRVKCLFLNENDNFKS